VLKEVEMPVALCLRIVNRVRPFGACVRKAAALFEIDGDRQEPLAGVEAHILHIPRLLNAKRRREKLVAHDPPNPRHRSPCARQNAAMLAAVKNKPSGWPLEKRPFLTAAARGGATLA
jgi:hypothetical protein